MRERKPYKYNNCDTIFALNCVMNQLITSVNEGNIKLKQHVGAFFKRDVSSKLKIEKKP